MYTFFKQREINTEKWFRSHKRWDPKPRGRWPGPNPAIGGRRMITPPKAEGGTEPRVKAVASAGPWRPSGQELESGKRCRRGRDTAHSRQEETATAGLFCHGPPISH